MAQPQWDPGNSPYNLVTDTDGPLDDNNVVEIPGPAAGAGAYGYALWFNTSSIWEAPNNVITDTSMQFNQMGILAGPAHNSIRNQPNVGGIVTLYIVQSLIDQSIGNWTAATISTATIDLTHAIPGQFYWSDPIPNFTIYGTVYNPSVPPVQFFYEIALTCSVDNYAVYAQRSCTLRMGLTWGSAGQAIPPPQPPSDWTGVAPPAYITNNGLYAVGVDLNLVNYVDLGVENLQPTFTLAGQPRPRGVLGALPGQLPKVGLYPQIQLTGQPRRAGNLVSGNITAQPILANPGGISGGTLWKPSPLCNG